MIRRIMTIFFVIFTISPGFLFATETVSVEKIPATMEDFLILRDSLALTPEGGAAVFVAAMIRYTEDPVLGMQFFTVVLVNDGTLHRKTTRGGYKGLEPSASSLFLIKKLDSLPYIAYSYGTGTHPENGYALPAGPLVLTITRAPGDDESDGKIKLFIKCSGADTPRPITLEKNDKGIWKAREFSSLFVDVRKPPVGGDDL